MYFLGLMLPKLEPKDQKSGNNKKKESVPLNSLDAESHEHG